MGLGDAPHLEACLDSLAATVRDVSYEVLVALNAPTPRLKSALSLKVAGARVVPFAANLGFGGALNALAEEARGEFLALLNDDATVQPGWLEGLVDIMDRRENCGIAGSRYINPDGTLQEAGSAIWNDCSTWAVGDAGNGRAAITSDLYFERMVDYCSGGSMIIRRSLWDILDGFDEAYYPAYWEDTDLCLRAAELGFECWYQPTSVVSHVRGASSKGGFRDFIAERGRAVFQDRWTKQIAARPHQSEGIEAAIWAAMGRPRRVLVIDDRVPTHADGSGFGRMYDAVTAMAATPGLHVALHPVDRLDWNTDLPSHGVRIIEDLEGHLSRLGVSYDAVVISRPHNFAAKYKLIRKRLPHAALIYDAEALFYTRIELQADVESDPAKKASLLEEATRSRAWEERLVSFADAAVFISPAEAALMQPHCKGPVHVVEPWLANVAPSAPSFGRRNHIGLVAAWAAGAGSPNADGLIWFAREVLPRVVAKVPGCRLLVTGGNPPEDVLRLEGPDVEFVGMVPNLDDFYDRVRAVISPTRFGAGVKIKTVEALQHGVPVVATREASRGLEPSAFDALHVSDDPAVFADMLVSLLTDELAWSVTRARALQATQSVDTGDAGVGRWPSIIDGAIHRGVPHDAAAR